VLLSSAWIRYIRAELKLLILHVHLKNSKSRFISIQTRFPPPKHRQHRPSLYLWHQSGVLFLCTKVGLDYLKGFLVNLLILVSLQVLDLVQATALLYPQGVRVGRAVQSRVMLAQFQDVVQAVQGHLDHFSVGNREQVAQGRYHAEFDQVANLVGGA